MMLNAVLSSTAEWKPSVYVCFKANFIPVLHDLVVYCELKQYGNV